MEIVQELNQHWSCTIVCRNTEDQVFSRPAPGFTPPYSIAVVELDEGPRLMTNIVDCPQTPDALQLDMPLEVTYRLC